MIESIIIHLSLWPGPWVPSCKKERKASRGVDTDSCHTVSNDLCVAVVASPSGMTMPGSVGFNPHGSNQQYDTVGLTHYTRVLYEGLTLGYDKDMGITLGYDGEGSVDLRLHSISQYTNAEEGSDDLTRLARHVGHIGHNSAKFG